MDAAAVDAEVLGHPLGAVVADRDEGVHGGRVLADQPQRLAAVRLAEAVEEVVLALQRADDRARAARA